MQFQIAGDFGHGGLLGARVIAINKANPCNYLGRYVKLFQPFPAFLIALDIHDQYRLNRPETEFTLPGTPLWLESKAFQRLAAWNMANTRFCQSKPVVGVASA